MGLILICKCIPKLTINEVIQRSFYIRNCSTYESQVETWLSWQRPHNLHETYQLPRVQLITPDDGNRRCPKHVEFCDKIKILNAWCIFLVIFTKIITMHGHLNIKWAVYVWENTFHLKVSQHSTASPQKGSCENVWCNNCDLASVH